MITEKELERALTLTFYKFYMLTINLNFEGQSLWIYKCPQIGPYTLYFVDCKGFVSVTVYWSSIQLSMPGMFH